MYDKNESAETGSHHREISSYSNTSLTYSKAKCPVGTTSSTQCLTGLVTCSFAYVSIMKI